MEIKCHLTKTGREKAEAYIKELNAKRKEILDAGLDTADYTPIPDIRAIEDDISWECTGLEYKEYLNCFGATDNKNADYPLCLQVEEDFTLFPKLGDFYKWQFHYDPDNEDNDWSVDVEGVGENIKYEMCLSPDIDDDECMRIKIDGKYYYFG